MNHTVGDTRWAAQTFTVKNEIETETNSKKVLRLLTKIVNKKYMQRYEVTVTSKNDGRPLLMEWKLLGSTFPTEILVSEFTEYPIQFTVKVQKELLKLGQDLAAKNTAKLLVVDGKHFAVTACWQGDVLVGIRVLPTETLDLDKAIYTTSQD